MNHNKKFYTIVIVTVLIMFGFRCLPTFGQVTPDGMTVLGVLLGCIFAWCFGETVWSSILALIVLTLFGFGGMAANFAGGFANGTIAMMMSAIVFCYGIEQSGLLAEISRWIVGQKWTQKSPWFLVFSFYLAAFVGGAIATNILPPVILLWSLFYGVAKELDLKPYEKFSTIILIGIGVVGYAGVALMPYSIMAVIVKGAAVGLNPAFEFNVPAYMFLNFLIGLLLIPSLVIVLKLCLGSKLNIVIPKKDAYKIQWSGKIKWSLFYLLVLIFAMLIPNLLPDGNPIKTLFNSTLGILGVLMLLDVLMMITRTNGQSILKIDEGISNIPWSLVCLVAAALGVSGYITADGMGVVETIISYLNPIMEGKSAFAVTLLFIIIGLVMTNFINDIVTCLVLYPIGVQFITAAGGSEMLFAILFAQVTLHGCFMPSGSVLGAMYHGNTTWLRSKDVFKYVGLMEGIMLIVVVIVTIVGKVLGI